ncbi:hypothetical protein [Paraburkholderia sp. J12]|uniref:hypothetical protein n=1 Tax=Paraburkholderia sp. J12 TaxID=2805432 RepID=UPI002ABE17C9|nr:hypothetical protein [Paraburkholderia sp. J12]
MDIYAIGRFCDRWIEKADSYRSGNLEDLFDRFFTLFVAYNHLYSAAAISYRASLDERRAEMLRGDRREATTIMARLIGQPRFTAQCGSLTVRSISSRGGPPLARVRIKQKSIHAQSGAISASRNLPPIYRSPTQTIRARSPESYSPLDLCRLSSVPSHDL